MTVLNTWKKRTKLVYKNIISLVYHKNGCVRERESVKNSQDIHTERDDIFRDLLLYSASTKMALCRLKTFNHLCFLFVLFSWGTDKELAGCLTLSYCTKWCNV